MPGHVLDVSRAFNGVLAQFATTSTSSLYESMAVINGRLVIFNKKSNPKQPKSTLVFGENTPVLDALTGRRIFLEPIKSTSTDHLSVHLIADQPEGQLFLVSLKQPHLMGDGITFAAILKRGTGEPQLLGDPTVIDYSFLPANELQRLHRYKFMILSRNHLLSLGQSSSSDDRILARYRSLVARLAEELKGGKTSIRATSVLEEADPGTGRKFVPPVFNVATKKLEIQEFPVELILNHPFLVFQRSDPFIGRSGVFFDNLNSSIWEGTATPAVQGRIDYDQKNRRYRILNLSKADEKMGAGLMTTPDEESLVVASIDGQPHVFFRSAMKDGTVGVSLTLGSSWNFFAAKKVAGLKRTMRGERSSSQYVHYLFLSQTDAANSEATSVVKILESSEHLKVTDIIPLSKKFANISELRARVHMLESEGKSKLLFDNVNIKLGSDREAVGGAPSDTVPYVDVRLSSGLETVQHYLRPMQSIRLSGSKLSWLLYQSGRRGKEQNRYILSWL
ncbi:MAG: hypothetical protein HC902_02155 [Calothrix sp. SM1_5_4]|nr:hypothetical protein [Calothrix sp. SM1_5_4]